MIKQLPGKNLLKSENLQNFHNSFKLSEKVEKFLKNS